MKNVRRFVFVLIVLIGAPLAIDTYFFNESLTNRLVLLINTEAREYHDIDKAMRLSRENETEANSQLLGLISSAENDIVYERAVRQYARNIFDDVPSDSLDEVLRLATDSRIRASARSGALEELAEYYFSQYSPYNRNELDAVIFSNDKLASIRANASPSLSSERILLEYANQVSARPLTTAYLLLEYGRAWYEGDKSMKDNFDDTFSLYQSLVQDIPITSPNLPKVHAAAAAGLFFAQAADQSTYDYLPDTVVQQAIFAAQDTVSAFSSITSRPPEDFAGSDFAPLAQYYVVLKAAMSVPQSSSLLNVKDGYAVYLEQNPSLDVKSLAPRLVELIMEETLSEPDKSEVISEENIITIE